jgi:hypothetical protein
MTGNTTQAVLDAVALVGAAKSDPAVRGRFNRMFAAIVWFAAGCALAATRGSDFDASRFPRAHRRRKRRVDREPSADARRCSGFRDFDSPRDIFCVTSLCIGNARHSVPSEMRGMALAC